MITLFKDPFFSDVFGKVMDTNLGLNIPKTKIQKNENDYQVLLPVPGLSKEDLKISVKDDLLKISYEKKEKSIFVDSFTKIYNLPEDVDQKGIEGKVENGILELTLPIQKKKSLEKLISLN